MIPCVVQAPLCTVDQTAPDNTLHFFTISHKVLQQRLLWSKHQESAREMWRAGSSVSNWLLSW